MRHDLGREQLHRLADMPVLVLAALLDEDHLVHARVRELLQMLAHLVRRADAAALADIVHVPARLLEAFPDPRHAGLVLAEDVIVAERIAEIAEAVRAAPLRLLRVVMDREAGTHGDIGVDRVADGHAFLGPDDGVVFLDPLPGHIRVDEGEGERADAGPRRGVDRLHARARHPERRMRLLVGLRQHVAAGHGEELPLEARIGLHGHHIGGLFGRLEPHRLLVVHRHAEAFHLHARRALAGAPVHPAVADEVERGDALGDARGMVVGRRGEHDRVAEPDPPGVARAGRQEHFRRGGVRILLQEVVLVLPHIVEAQPVGEFHLLQGLMQQVVVRLFLPASRQLVFVKQSEFHGGRFLPGGLAPASIAPRP